MARNKSVPKTTRAVALMISAQRELRQIADDLVRTTQAVGIYAEELATNNLHASAVGVQAEGIRLAMAGQTLRAVCERLSIANQLGAEAGAQ